MCDWRGTWDKLRQKWDLKSPGFCSPVTIRGMIFHWICLERNIVLITSYNHGWKTKQMGYNLYHYYGYIRSFCLHGHPSYELIIICGCVLQQTKHGSCNSWDPPMWWIPTLAVVFPSEPAPSPSRHMKSHFFIALSIPFLEQKVAISNSPKFSMLPSPKSTMSTRMTRNSKASRLCWTCLLSQRLATWWLNSRPSWSVGSEIAIGSYWLLTPHPNHKNKLILFSWSNL